MSNLTKAPAVAPGLDIQEQRAIALMLDRMESHERSNNLRSLYYLGKRSLRAAGKLGMAMPPSLGRLETILGWPAKAVTTLEHRLNPTGFVVRGESDPDPVLEQIAWDNQLTELQSMAHTAALIHGTAFITVSAGDESMGEPPAIIAARSAREATALYSPRTRRITAGLTVNTDERGNVAQVVLWRPDQIVEVTKTGTTWSVRRLPHWLGAVPMERLAFRPHLEQDFGMPRITDEVMGLNDAAVRTMIRMEGTAEFFSFPQRYALGVEKDDFEDTFKTYLNRFLAFGRDEDTGKAPELGQFTPSSPQPHIDQLRAIAGQFSGATSIPLNYLGIVHDNPSSADAIHAAEADLIAVAGRATGGFGPPWARIIGYGHQIYNRDYQRDPRMEGLMTRWRDPATPTASAAAQSVMSLVSTGVLPPNSPVTYRLLGYDEATVAQLVADARSYAGRQALAALTPPTPDPEVDALTAEHTT
ncbi:phage portal protein [Corynebacterium phoceense]|uniref:phage portal protein n=1 Tax=Corynebacterium phoceense TaxID=1686286 RepID=UPI00211D0617|nr:phage portal protein [Corynebacterium phoceense]MCQ9345868.1 phage portal protein [Corynebacterium phoceense]